MDQNPPILADKQFLEVTSQKKLCSSLLWVK